MASRGQQDQTPDNFYPGESAGMDDYSDNADEANVTGSMLIAQKSSKQNMEDYAFSPRDG